MGSQAPSNNGESVPETQPSKRTLQNRKAQREFRERKASYVKSLEQKLRAYETNEIQSSVELQRAARRLKEENEQQKEVIRQLQERITILESQLPPQSGMVGLPPSRAPGARSRGGAHIQQAPQPPPQTIYNQPQGFGGDVTAYDMLGPAPSFQPSTNPPGYFQYAPQQVGSS
jgi:hypothetical protein